MISQIQRYRKKQKCSNSLRWLQSLKRRQEFASLSLVLLTIMINKKKTRSTKRRITPSQTTIQTCKLSTILIFTSRSMSQKIRSKVQFRCLFQTQNQGTTLWQTRIESTSKSRLLSNQINRSQCKSSMMTLKVLIKELWSERQQEPQFMKKCSKSSKTSSD